MDTTRERLNVILARDYKLPRERLTRDAPLAGLGIDSLGLVELLWTIEETFHIKMPTEPVELSTLDDVVHFVDELVASQLAVPVNTA